MSCNGKETFALNVPKEEFVLEVLSHQIFALKVKNSMSTKALLNQEGEKEIHHEFVYNELLELDIVI